MSEYQQIIREAQILASSPCEIVRYIEGRSRDNLEDSGEDFETKLLCLKDRRIDLALAQHCVWAETAKTLFFRDTEDLVLKLSVLTNKKIGKYECLDQTMPYAIFSKKSQEFKFSDNSQEFENYIKTISENELHALFSNPTIDRDFVCDFFMGKSAWGSMDEEHRVLSIRYLSRNTGFTSAYKPKEWDDVWDDYQHGKAFTAAYTMADTVPVRSDWANALKELYAKLPNDIHGVQGNIDTNRWIASEPEDLDAERKANAEGRLSTFQSVRFYCALAGLKNNEGRISHHLASNDIAERSASYRCGKFSAWKVWWSLRKDGAFALGQFLKNDDIWNSRRKRKIIDSYYMKNCIDLLESEFNYGETLERRMRESPHNFSKSELDAYDINHLSSADQKLEKINKIMSIILIVLAVILYQNFR